jgi:hypothetical protein
VESGSSVTQSAHFGINKAHTVPTYFVNILFGVKGIFAGFVPRSGHRRVGMASARPGPSWALDDSELGWGHRRGMTAPTWFRISTPGVMDALYSLSSPKTVCAWWKEP